MKTIRFVLRAALFFGWAPRCFAFLGPETEPKEAFSITGYSGAVNSVVFSPDGTRILSAGANGVVAVWGAVNGDWKMSIKADLKGVSSAAYSPDQSQIVTAGNDKDVYIWDAGTGAKLRTLQGHGYQKSSAGFNYDGSRVVTADFLDKTATIWDARTGKAILTLTGHGDWVTSAVFSPSGKRVLTASWDGTAKLWDAQTGEEEGSWTSSIKQLRFALFNPDGASITTIADDGTFSMGNLKTEDRLAASSNQYIVGFGAFSRDGQRLVVIDSKGAAVIYSVPGGAPLRSWAPRTGAFRSASFNSDGSRVVTGSSDEKIQVWIIENGEDLLQAGRRLRTPATQVVPGRGLTAEEAFRLPWANELGSRSNPF